jgi:hypothetical protein
MKTRHLVVLVSSCVAAVPVASNALPCLVSCGSPEERARSVRKLSENLGVDVALGRDDHSPGEVSGRLDGYVFLTRFQRRNTRGRPSVQTERTGTEVGDLQEASRHHHVLEEVNHLVVVSEIAMEENRRADAEHRHHERRKANPVTRQQQQATAQFDEHGG